MLTGWIGRVGAACAWVYVSCATAFGDGVHSAPFVLQDVTSVSVQNRRVLADVSLHYIGTQVVALQAVSAEGTVRQALSPVPTVAAGQRRVVTIDLQFYRDVPQAFSLVLDFGTGGINTTLVNILK